MFYFFKKIKHAIWFGGTESGVCLLSQICIKNFREFRNKNFSDTKQQVASFLDNSLHHAELILPFGFQRQRRWGLISLIVACHCDPFSGQDTIETINIKKIY